MVHDQQTAACLRKAYELILRNVPITRACEGCGKPVDASRETTASASAVCAECAVLTWPTERSGVHPVERCSLCREPTAPHLLEDMRGVDPRLRGCCPVCFEAVEDLGPEEARARAVGRNV